MKSADQFFSDANTLNAAGIYFCLIQGHTGRLGWIYTDSTLRQDFAVFFFCAVWVGYVFLFFSFFLIVGESVVFGRATL